MVRGVGADLTVCTTHPDTGALFVGTALPDWIKLRNLVTKAACVFPGIRTQSWDIALTDQGPVFLEVNYGGDLNLAQLAEGRGVLDAVSEIICPSADTAADDSNGAACKDAPFAKWVGRMHGMENEKKGEGATACAGRAAREAAARPPPEAAPLHPSGFAVAGLGEDPDGRAGEGAPPARRSPRNPEQEP